MPVHQWSLGKVAPQPGCARAGTRGIALQEGPQAASTWVLSKDASSCQIR
jgi:hypothetical protein